MNEDTRERRPIGKLYGHVDSVGRSYAYLDCPYCGVSVRVYIWSFSGGGKRCTGKGCTAKHTRHGSYRQPPAPSE